MEIKEIFKLGLNKIKLENAEGTYNQYLNHLNHFKKYLDKNNIIEIEKLTENDIINYFFECKKTCCNRTLNIRRSILKNIFKYANYNTNLLSNIDKFKETKKTYDMIDLEDIKRIRRYLFNLDDNIRNNLYHKAIILILIDTGCRRSELIKIEKSAVNIDNRSILLKETKTKEEREVFFTEKTKSIIIKLLTIKSNHKYLLHNILKNRAANLEDVNQVFKKYKKVFNLKKFHPHMLRHSFVSLMLEAGVQRKIVMNLTGHKNDETLARYEHIKKERIKESYNNKYNID